MSRPRKIETENHVKALVKDWYEARNSWSYAPIQNGLGEHGIPDRIGCVPVVVTAEMVGKRVGLFVAVESKAPGRRGEKNRGMTANQALKISDIRDAGGLAICCDGVDDLHTLNREIDALRGVVHG